VPVPTATRRAAFRKCHAFRSYLVILFVFAQFCTSPAQNFRHYVTIALEEHTRNDGDYLSLSTVHAENGVPLLTDKQPIPPEVPAGLTTSLHRAASGHSPGCSQFQTETLFVAISWLPAMDANHDLRLAVNRALEFVHVMLDQ